MEEVVRMRGVGVGNGLGFVRGKESLEKAEMDGGSEEVDEGR